MVWARRQFAVHERSARAAVPVGEILGAAESGRARGGADGPGEGGPTRRELLAGAGTLAAGALWAASPATALAAGVSQTAAAPRIAIVGVGLAGLRCAHLLWTEHPGRPIVSTVYEAHPHRAGGRCWTLRDFFGGLITEHGGSFLNRDETAVRGLARRLGLRQGIVDGGDLPRGQEVFFIDGRLYSESASTLLELVPSLMP
jgi:monoamine oxidase